MGAAWVFTRARSSWTQQGQRLTGAGEVGAGNFGSSVAVSSDGNTVLIGPRSDDGNVGAAWVFKRSGSTWSQEGPRLTGAGDIGLGQFGSSVAVSSDGNTALIGAPGDRGSFGSASVFRRVGSRWIQHGPKLTSPRTTTAFGQVVALSGDGSTALIGSPYGDVAWVFVHVSTTWREQGTELTGGPGPSGLFGASVALASDGNTALIGDPAAHSFLGAAWTFTRRGSTWTRQQALTGTGESSAGWLGNSVALSGDGNAALIGALNDAPSPGANFPRRQGRGRRGSSRARARPGLGWVRS
jgi:hypothetical protein